MTDDGASRDDVSSRILLAIRDYAAMKLGPEMAHRAFESAVRECGSTVARATDPRGWVPLDVLEAVYVAFVDTLGPEFLVDAATWVIPARRDLSAMSLSAMTTADIYFANLDRARSFFARHLRFEMRREGRGHYRADLHYLDLQRAGETSCLVGKAVLVAAPLLFDLPPASVTETACRKRGADRCSFDVTFVSEAPYALYGAAAGALVGITGALALHGPAWLVAPVVGWSLGRELYFARKCRLMTRVTEEQRRALAENETDFQRRFDEIKALNIALEQRIGGRTETVEDAPPAAAAGSGKPSRPS